MFSFLQREPTHLEFGPRSYDLNLSCGVVLAIYEILDDEELDELTQCDVCLSFLIKAGRWEDLPYPQKKNLLSLIFEEFINDKSIRPSKKPPVLDYKQDAGFIWVAFMQTYDIDLRMAKDQLSWKEFQTLLSGLPDGTKLREVLEIRSRPMPKPNKHNAEEIRALSEAKAFYALKRKKKKNNFQQEANSLFMYLKSIAERR